MGNCLKAMTSISNKIDSIFVTDCLFTSPSSKPFTQFEFWFFKFTGKYLKCLFSLLLYFSRNEGTDNDLYLNILCPYQLQRNVVAHKIYKGGLSWIKKAGTSHNATNAEKRFKYEKEKRPKRIHVDWYGIKITCFQKFLLKCLGLAEN